jgi:hypothetical protein
VCVCVWGGGALPNMKARKRYILVGKDNDDDDDDDNNNNLGSRVGVVSIRTGGTVRGSISCRDKIFLSYPKHPERLVRSTEALTQWIQEGVKRPGRKADHSLPPSYDMCRSNFGVTFHPVPLVYMLLAL